VLTKKVKLVVFVFLCFLLFTKAPAQDIHFSQYLLSPLTVNPGMTGGFNGIYRFDGIFRKQWRSVTIPYNTIALSTDARDFADIRNFNVGFNFFYDRAGDSHYSNLQAALSLAWSKPFDRKRHKYLNIGIQTSFSQRTFDLAKLKFDSQYVPDEYGGNYFGSLPTNESFSGFNVMYPDIHAGIFYHWQPKKRKKITTGISLNNILTPKLSYLDNNEIRLDRRLNIHAEGQFMVSNKVDVLPQVLLMLQGTYYQITPGIVGKYIIDQHMYRYRAVYAGLFTRTRDAAFLTLGMDYNEWYLGISYDLNYSKLVPASRGRGGWEVGFLYTIGKMPDRRKYRDCPDYM